jgi:pimeloyl-ACP methyl ester carboxylesterase
MLRHQYTLLGLILICLVQSIAVFAQDPKNGHELPRVLRSAGSCGQTCRSSPFEPPKCSDSAFIVDCAALLDTGCTFRSGGPLVFTIKVGRVVGDVQKLKQKGLISPTATLQMPAFDVDFAGASGVNPERDRVTFNGQVVPSKYLTGANNTWKLNQFSVPIEWVNFPSDPGPGGSVTPADNTVRIDIDTENSSEVWCTSIDWAALTFEVARPVVLVHGIFRGLFGNPWTSVWMPSLNNLGLPNSGELNMGNLNGIEDNASQVASEVSAARQRWGVDKVNLVCHSKGGIDSRHFAEHSDSVERLIQIATPNAGSPVADYVQVLLVVGAGLYNTLVINELAGPAGYQLTRPHMALYNYLHGFNPKIEYTALAGDYTLGCTSFSCRVFETFLFGILGRGDLIVPVSSVHSLGYTQNRLFSSAGSDMQATHFGQTGSPDIFTALCDRVRTPGTNLIAPEQAPPLSLVPTLSRVGSITQGQTQTQTLLIDQATPVRFTLLYPSGNLNLALIAPSGQRFDASSVAANPNVGFAEEDFLGSRMEVFAFNTPEIGQWTVEVSAPQVIDPSGSAVYGLTAWLENPAITMTGGLTDASVHAGESLQLLGTLKSGSTPITGATVTAKILLPDNSTGSATLHDDGTGGDSVANDGIYTGGFAALQPGSYRIVLTATRPTGNGLAAFSREVFTLATASASSSSFNNSFQDSGVDTDNDTFFNQLVITTSLNITAAANYRVLGVLSDSQGHTQTATAQANLAPGTRTVTLVFDGATIYTNGVNGPYQLTTLRLAEESSGGLLLVEERSNVYQTTAYNFNQFQHAAVSLTGQNSATGVDTNSNNKFDRLDVNIGVNIVSAGSYEWSARLADQGGVELGFASGSGPLTAGSNTLALTFPGMPIGASRVDGPYFVRGLLVFGAGSSLVAPEVFATPPFQARQFEGFPEGAKFEQGSTKVVLSDPLACTGPGNIVTVQAQFVNTGNAAQSDNPGHEFRAALPPQLLGLIGSCVATGNGGAPKGVCAVAGTEVTWNGAVAMGETITLRYQAQIADSTISGVQVCVTSVINYDSDSDGTNDAATSVVACTTVNCPIVGPGRSLAAHSEVSGQKSGSVLVYNIYTSSIGAPNTQNTRINLTNVHPTLSLAVHLFFVDGASCAVADSFLCLTPNQTASFQAWDIDPGTTGYLVAVATDLATGCPINFNYLIGDAYVKFSSGHAANLGAEAIAALAGGLPACNANSPTAQLNLDGVSYNRVPRTLALDNIPSRADGNETLIILNRIGGNLGTGAATLTGLFGILYDDAESPISFSFSPGTCQFRSTISNSFPRTTPRFETFIAAGRSGWMKFSSQNDQGILGAAINFNASAGAVSSAYNQGHNLHKLTTTPSMVLTIPVFPPSC